MAGLLSIVNALRHSAVSLEHFGPITIYRDTICVGNSAVAARCRINGIEGDRLIKCYFRPRRNAPLLYGASYYPREMAIYSIEGRKELVDVALTEWIDGVPLDRYVGREECDFRVLSRAFDTFALRQLAEEYAHGDIKPENIVVRDDGSLRLVDMDAAWREEFDPSDVEECGTPEFCHPKRELARFDKHIDDFPLALLSVIFAASAIDPVSFRGAVERGRLLFSPTLIATGGDAAFERAKWLLLGAGDVAHYNIALSLELGSGVIPELGELLSAALSSGEQHKENRERVGIDASTLRDANDSDALTAERDGGPWRADDEERLMLMVVDGHTTESIARRLHRSERDVHRHIRKLGLPATPNLTSPADYDEE
ncbi:MAG: hypothetical protein J6J64_03970 [Alistipes sp.]|nr:hypothetical protein [Alistipes sp.]